MPWYYVDTVGKNEKRIAEYVRNQLQEDIANDQLTFKEYVDPFTGSKNKQAKRTAALAAARKLDAVARLFNVPSGTSR